MLKKGAEQKQNCLITHPSSDSEVLSDHETKSYQWNKSFKSMNTNKKNVQVFDYFPLIMYYYGGLFFYTLPRNELLCQLFGGLGSNEFHIK